MKFIKRLVNSLWFPVFLGLCVGGVGIAGCCGLLEKFDSWHAMLFGFVSSWYVWLFALNVADRRASTDSPS